MIPWLAACARFRVLTLVLLLASAPAAAQPSESALLDSTYRIDILRVAVTFDYHPDSSMVEAAARLEFRMRPGQSVPRFHFSPLGRTGSVIRSLALDGQIVAYPSAAVTLVPVSGSSQPIAQIDRPLAPGSVHTLDIAYRLDRPTAFPRFSTEVNDLAGRGNEELFPTLNTPHELAHHRLVFRVHGPRAFHCIGSGLVQRQDEPDGSVQQWVLDTEREVASYTVMFALLPVSDSDLQERIVHGIPVRILALRNGPAIAPAFTRLETWLPLLVSTFGPYPAPRGLSILLVGQGGGMEYFGGTITTLGALTHEVTHSYFACSVVARTYRDTWLDEAITQWFTDVNEGRSYTAIPDDYTANFVGARSPVSVGFSTLAYSDGARMMQYMADRLGGNARMFQFLRYVYERYAFTPFTTLDFGLFYRDFSGIDLRTQFERWLYRSSGQPWDRTVPIPFWQRHGANPASEPVLGEGR